MGWCVCVIVTMIVFKCSSVLPWQCLCSNVTLSSGNVMFTIVFKCFGVVLCQNNKLIINFFIIGKLSTR